MLTLVRALFEPCCHVVLALYGQDSEEDEEHPLTRDELHAKTMRGLAKREASAGKRAAPKTAPKARGR